MTDQNDETHQKLLLFIKEKGIEQNCKFFEHEPVNTSEEAAKVRNTPLSEGAKALVLKDEKGEFHLLVMSATRKLDNKKLKKELKSKSTKFATAEELFQLTKCLPGSVPPFASLWNKQTLMDNSLQQFKKISFNSGLRTKSIEMSLSDYLEIEKPRIIDVTKD